jgi:hypothetical protein
MLAVARGDEEVVIRDGITMRFENMPTVMREEMERFRRESGTFAATLRFTPGPALALTITTVSGSERAEHSMNVRPFPPDDGADAGYVGMDGAVFVQLGFRLHPDRAEMSFTPGLELTPDAATNEAACGFLEAIYGADAVEFSGDLFPGGPKTMSAGAFGDVADHAASISYLREVYAQVVYLQDQTGTDIPVHSPPFTDEELDDLEGSVDILRRRAGSGNLSELSFTMPVAGAAAFAAKLTQQLPVVMAVDREIFGHPVRLGLALSRMPPVRIAQLPALAALDGPKVILKVIPVGDGRMEFQVLGPRDEVPIGAIPLIRPIPGASSGLWTPDPTP